MTKTQKLLAIPTLAAVVLLGGAAAGYASLASAATTDDTQSSGIAGTIDRMTGGHIGTNGTKEELLTGDTLARVTAAAQTALPGATIDRAESDAEGAVYEAHMTKADGSHVTLKFDANFGVTGTEDGPGLRGSH